MTDDLARVVEVLDGADEVALACHINPDGDALGSMLGLHLILRELEKTAHDTASLIADWHHYAILELVHLRDFRPDSRWTKQRETLWSRDSGMTSAMCACTRTRRRPSRQER